MILKFKPLDKVRDVLSGRIGEIVLVSIKANSSVVYTISLEVPYKDEERSAWNINEKFLELVEASDAPEFIVDMDKVANIGKMCKNNVTGIKSMISALMIHSQNCTQYAIIGRKYNTRLNTMTKSNISDELVEVL